MHEVDLSLFPVWKQAVRDFLQEFNYGDLVSHEWLSEHFGITQSQGVKMTEAEFKSRQFELLGNVEQFKHELLVKHQICLQPVRGSGYRWTAPSEQTSIARKEFERDAGKVFRAVSRKLKHVRVGELTEEQRRENVDAISKISMLKSFARKQLRLE